MATLAEYLGTPGAPTLIALAEAIGVSKGRLSQLRDSVEWPPALALAAERETAGAVDAAALSPIIHMARETATVVGRAA